jgi:hypothetical protein
MASERVDVVVLGRKIGTETGWDVLDETMYVFYDFKPVEDLKHRFPENIGDLIVDYGSGMFKVCDNEGKVIWSRDMIEALKDFPRE